MDCLEEKNSNVDDLSKSMMLQQFNKDFIFLHHYSSADHNEFSDFIICDWNNIVSLTESLWNCLYHT